MTARPLNRQASLEARSNQLFGNRVRLSSGKWYYSRDGKRVGPFGYEEMRELLSEGRIAHDTRVFGPTFTEWRPAHQVPALSDPFQPLSYGGRVVTAPDFPESAVHRSASAEPTESRLNGVGGLPTNGVDARSDRAPSQARVEEAEKTPDRCLEGPEPADSEAALGSLQEPEPESGEHALEILLGAVEARRSVRRQRRRERAIRKTSDRLRYQALEKNVIRPTLKAFMGRLHAKGHPSRLSPANKRRVRLDFILDAAPAVRGAVELELMANGQVSLRFFRQRRLFSESELPLAEIDADAINWQLSDALRRMIVPT